MIVFFHVSVRIIRDQWVVDPSMDCWFPELLDNISPQLVKRMQGKSCFNFHKIDETLFDELAHLTQSGFAYYREEGLICTEVIHHLNFIQII